MGRYKNIFSSDSIEPYFIGESRQESLIFKFSSLLIHSVLGIVLVTISSSGSETSNAAIISNGLYKMGVEDEKIIPCFAVMNPEYTLKIPKYNTSCGIADILSHLIERYLTLTENVDTTDYLIEGAIKSLLLNGKRLLQTPNDYNIRAEIQWLASIAHNNLLDTGRVSDWASHRIEHEISAQYNINHGEGMAIVFLAYLKYISEHRPFKSAQLANRIFDVDYYNHSQKEMTLILVEKLYEFFKRLELKTSLRELNIDDKDFKLMADRATNNNEKEIGHYFPLKAEQIVEVLNLAL